MLYNMSAAYNCCRGDKAMGIKITKNVQGKEASSQLELLPVLHNVIQIKTTMDLSSDIYD